MLNFSHPYILCFLLLIPILWGFDRYFTRKRKKEIEKYIDPSMIPRLFPEGQKSLKGIKEVLIMISLVLIILSLSGLRVGSGLKELKQEGMDVIVAMDISTSMSAQDISPSRLERSKYEVKRLITLLKGDRIGLIAFAGVSYLQCPITSDYRTAAMMLEMMDVDLLPVQGTAFADAINTALDAFPDENQQYKAIIMISDGEDHEQDIKEAAQRAAEEHVVIYTLGVGTLKGSTIPIYDKSGNMVDYMRDGNDRVITTILQENTLKEISAITNGRYYRLGAVRNPIESIYEHILHGDRQEYQTHEFARYRELYLIFASIALIILLVGIALPESKKRRRM